jgi:AcrR family transcriptional regulator
MEGLLPMPPRPRFHREDWLALGLTALAEAGPDGLRLDAICARAGVSKGSFYHHFSDHTAYLEGVVQGWADEALRAVERNAATISDLHLAPALEEGIRALAPRAPSLTALVAEVEAERIQSLANRYVDRFEVLWPRAVQLAELELAVFRGGAQRDEALSGLYAKMVDSYLRPARPSAKASTIENEDQPSLFPLTP